jgi:hypothetical protein
MIINAALSGVGAMKEKYAPAQFERTTEAAWAAMRRPLKDSKSRRRCEKSATASYVGMIRNP